MDKVYCPICKNEPNKFFYKGVVLYSQCANCKTIFCEALDQEGLVGGFFEIERNEKENHLRVGRVNKMAESIPKEEVRILDFGAGHGGLIRDLNKSGYVHVDGYDSYNEEYCRLPNKESYHIIMCVETAEHFSHPFMEFDVMYKSLTNYGIAYIETGYLNATWEDGIKDEENPYINPNAGHSTVYTHHSIDLIMALKGFAPMQHFNRHCRIFKKIPK